MGGLVVSADGSDIHTVIDLIQRFLNNISILYIGTLESKLTVCPQLYACMDIYICNKHSLISSGIYISAVLQPETVVASVGGNAVQVTSKVSHYFFNVQQNI